MSPTVTMVCLEPMPEGFEVPPKWKMVRLGDICEVFQGGKLVGI
jgi:hypothetical protein